MGYSGTYGNQQITFPQIVMEQIKIIQTIYSKELRDGDRVLKNALGEQLIEGEDSRYSFLQSIELFGSLLTPYFIEGSKTYTGIKYPEFEKYCELLDKELVEILQDDDFKKLITKVFYISPDENLIEKIKKDESFRTQLHIFFLNYKIKEARRVFRRLIQLLKEHDFLASQSYTDGDFDSSNVYDEEKDGPLEWTEDDD